MGRLVWLYCLVTFKMVLKTNMKNNCDKIVFVILQKKKKIMKLYFCKLPIPTSTLYCVHNLPALTFDS